MEERNGIQVGQRGICDREEVDEGFHALQAQRENRQDDHHTDEVEQDVGKGGPTGLYIGFPGGDIGREGGSEVLSQHHGGRHFKGNEPRIRKHQGEGHRDGGRLQADSQ